MGGVGHVDLSEGFFRLTGALKISVENKDAKPWLTKLVLGRNRDL